MISKTMLAVSFFVFVSSSAGAALVDIPQNQLSSYKRAVELAGAKTGDLKCELKYGYFTERILIESVRQAQSAQLDDSGAQPILIFRRDFSATSRVLTTVTSSHDYKRIKSYSADEQVWGDINSGDLRNPVITKGFKSVALAICE